MDNYVKLEFLSKASNESFARVAVAAFVARLDPTLDELADIKTAVSEAVTNAIIHGYENTVGVIFMGIYIEGRKVTITVEDRGKGIEDIEKARMPLYTTKPDGERSGMGFTVMETFMDSLEIESKPGEGTKVTMTKTISSISH